MRIVDYELYELPPRWQLLKVETSDGLIGWGEPVVEARARTTRTAVEKLLDTYLVGENPLHIERHWQTMYRGGFYRGGPVHMSALSGIDQALWDIKGKHYDAPIYDLLGGKARDRIRLYQHVHGGTPGELAESAARHVDAGFSALKMTPTEKLERIDTPAAVETARNRVGAVRDAIGTEVDLALDFHGRVSKPMARRLATSLEEFSPMFIEEPVLAEHNEALPKLAAHTTIPIATGERMFSRWDFKSVLEDGGVDVVQPDVSHAGGITELKKIASMAEAYDVAFAPHSPLGPVSLAASLHLDACTPNALVQEQVVHLPDAPNYLVDDTSFQIDDDGFVELPPGPGLGVTVDEEHVRKAEIDDAWDFPLWTHDDGSITEW